MHPRFSTHTVIATVLVGVVSLLQASAVRAQAVQAAPMEVASASMPVPLAGANIERFEFSGGPFVFSEAQLQAAVANWLGRRLNLAELQDAAAAITQLYRANGYFQARAWPVYQDAGAHSVTMAISEGRLGSQDGEPGDGLDLKLIRKLPR